ncbi:MAG: cache domain-containing protein [Desulfobacterales bacterium]
MDAKSVKNWFQIIPIRILLPVVLTVALFIATIFLLILPILKERMLNDKREMIRELTETAWSVLDGYWKKETSGQMSSAEARARAVEELRRLRYGPESKDYFWINDQHPYLIMHPYRPDLEGRDISGFSDSKGKKLFVEFVTTVKKDGAGYVDYQWQWKDDPQRIVPKISYVKGFEPWGWIVGTGIYVEDVRAEIAAITRKLTAICLAILVLIIGLSTYVIWQSARSQRRQRQADRENLLHREQLFQADKMATLGTLVSGIAHEINNPVTFIMLNAPILKETWQAVLPILDEYHRQNDDFKIGRMDYGRLRERIPLLLADINEGAVRVKTIVGELKDFARQTPSEMADQVEINAIAAKSVGLVGNLIKKTTRRFSTVYGSDIPRFKGNSQKIEQVIVNLLVNACQALPDPERAIRLTTSCETRAGRVVIEVRDEGCGMPAEVLEKIRNPFFTTKRESGGTGLGLAIADRIVGEHGGTMHFTSTENGGTTVRVCLPAAGPVSPDQAPDPKDAS